MILTFRTLLAVALLAVALLAQRPPAFGFGVSCQGAVGTPALWATVPPTIGGVMSFLAIGLQPSAPGAFVIGFNNTSSGGVSLPLDLGFIGAPSCFLLIDIWRDWFVVASGAGTAEITIAIPSDPSLQGLVVMAQYASLEAPAGRPFALTTTTAIGQTLWPL